MLASAALSSYTECKRTTESQPALEGTHKDQTSGPAQEGVQERPEGEMLQDPNRLYLANACVALAKYHPEKEMGQVTTPCCCKTLEKVP